MRITINKPVRVNCLSGEVEVTEQEYNRLMLLNVIEEKAEMPVFEKESKETPEKEKRTTRKAKK